MFAAFIFLDFSSLCHACAHTRMSLYRARFYGMMVDDLQAVYRRLSPLMEEYQKNATEDRELTVSLKTLIETYVYSDS